MNLPPTTPNTTTLPGVFVSLYDKGILLTGPSHSGKSELALALLDRGHALIADDAVEWQAKSDGLWGQSPPMLQDLMEIRDIGILNVRRLFGDNAIKHKEKLFLIIDLTNTPETEPDNRLQGNWHTHTLLNQSVQRYAIHHCPHRPSEVLVETLVKNCILSQSGYDATQELLARQAKALEATQL